LTWVFICSIKQYPLTILEIVVSMIHCAIHPATASSQAEGSRKHLLAHVASHGKEKLPFPSKMMSTRAGSRCPNLAMISRHIGQVSLWSSREVKIGTPYPLSFLFRSESRAKTHKSCASQS
jgi:hypothetical protein